MNKLNVCILDRGSRGGLSGLIYHYARLGHNVFYPFPGTGGLSWDMSPLWPVLLHRSTHNPGITNFEYYKFDSQNQDLLIYGEDQFLLKQNRLTPLTEENITCSLVDFDKEDIKIDLFHTTDHVIGSFDIYKNFAKQKFPNAKWVSSTFDHFSPLRSNDCHNICRMLPANYDKEYNDRNNINFYRNQVEFDILGVGGIIASENRKGFASFNHNFHVRHPNEFALFNQMNQYLKPHNIQAVNYGGNIRRQGADIRYDGSGPTGNYTTLSPRQAAQKFQGLKAVVHFKGYDWAGGVEAYARFACTPVVVLKDYVDATHSNGLLVHGKNSIHVTNAKEAAQALYELENNPDLVSHLVNGMNEISQRIHHEEYWKNWETFITNLK